MLLFCVIVATIINFICIVELIFIKRQKVNATISWILLLVLFPIGGVVIYNAFGRGIRKSRKFRLKKEEDMVFKKQYRSESNYLNLDIKHSGSVANNRDMISMLSNTGEVAFTTGNNVELYSDSNKFFGSLIEELKKATNSINIQFYIFKDDEIGKKIINILEEKAEAGVKVKVLYDALGSRGLRVRSLRKIVKAENGEVAAFFPSIIKVINFKLNYRNHRKIVVIDDNIGFVGGFNIGDEYMGRYKKFGKWRDTHLKIVGPAVTSLNLRFLMDWRFATNNDIDLSECLLNPAAECGNVSMQIVASGPDMDIEAIKYGYIKMIQKAQKYIYIQSPYFILDDSLLDALKIAIHQGIDVRIMIPSKPDHPFVYWASLSYSGELLQTGARVYIYDEKAFLHSKTIVIDDEICSVGTANMDIRSFSLNFEVNAFMYSSEIAIKQRKAFEDDIKVSKEITNELYVKRSLGVRMKESVSRLLSPLL